MKDGFHSNIDNETHSSVNISTDLTATDIAFKSGDITVDEVPPIEVPQVGVLEGEGEGEINEGVPEDFTVEDCEMLCNSVFNLPSLFAGAYLMRTPEQVKPFAFELFKYCQKKEINPMDYFFDEFGLLITGATLAGGMYKDYTKHKEEETKKEKDVDKDRLPGHREIIEE